VNRRQMLLAAPLGVAVLGGGAFYAMLRGMAAGTFDPRGVPSPILGKPMPPFDLPAQPPGQGFSSADLGQGKPVLINFFASWCAPCVEEHPALMALAQTGMPISDYYGVDGLEPRDDLAGLNLTTVPKVLIETGNMRNPTDAALLVTRAFQVRAAAAITAAIVKFLRR